MILSMQTISKDKVSNYYNFGKKIQKWCKENMNLVLDTIGCGYMDGGCRVLAEALQIWSKGYLVPKVMFSNNGDEHVVSTLRDSQGLLMLIDADGLGSMENLRTKMRIIENVQCNPSVKSVTEHTTIKNYQDTHPDLIQNIANKLEESFGEFKPSSIVRGIRNISLPTVITSFETPICDLNEVLTKSDKLHQIPKTSCAADLLSFMFTPIKDITKVDYMQVFRTIADRDGWQPTDDDYCSLITKYFKEVKHDSRATQADFLSVIPPWGQKAAKLYFKYIMQDLHDVLYKNNIIMALENQLGSSAKPLLACTTSDGINEYTHNGKFLWADNKSRPHIAYVKELWTADKDKIKEVFEQYPTRTLVALIGLYKENPLLKTDVLDFLSQNIKVSDFVYSDIHTIINDMEDHQKTDNLKNVVFHMCTNVSLERLFISFSQKGMPAEWINSFIEAAIDGHNNTTKLFYNLYKYPDVLNVIKPQLIDGLLESFMEQSYHFIDLDDHKLEHLTRDEALMHLVTQYSQNINPEVIKMMDTARLIDSEHPFDEFKKMFALRNQGNDVAAELPSL